MPIAVAAFSGEALERRQIDQATDLQLNVPNVSYTKTNFTGSNFQIRGIGVSSVAASGDSGVETHFNSMPIKNPRLFETEYFDVQRVEVLRGPQGTLYGRNATGGAVNIIARKPEKDFAGNVELEAGNYSALKGEGHGQHPARRHRRCALRRHHLQARRLHRQPCDRQRHRRPRSVVGTRRAALHAERCHGRDADGQSLQGRLEPLARDEADVSSRSGRRARLPAGRARASRPATCAARSAAFSASWVRCCSISAMARPTVRFAGFPLPPALINTGTDVNTGSPVPADLHKTFAEFDPIYEADETIAHAGVLARLRLDDLHDSGGLPGDELPVADRLQLDDRGPAVQRPGVPAFGGGDPDQRDRLRRAARLAQRQRPRRRRVLAQLRPVGPGSRPVVGRAAPVLGVRRSVEFPGRRCSTSTPTTTRTTTSSPASSTTGRR